MDRTQEQLFNENQKLAHYFAHKYRVAGYELEDLAQEGLLCLYKAAMTFKPSKGVKFSTYASKIIKGRIFFLLRSQASEKRDGEKSLCELDNEIMGKESAGYNDHEERQKILGSLEGEDFLIFDMLLNRERSGKISEMLGVSHTWGTKKILALGERLKSQMRAKGIGFEEIFRL